MKKSWIFATHVILFFWVLRIDSVSVDDCLCWDEMSVEMKEKSMFLKGNSSLVPSNYEYLGFKSNGGFVPCICSDITIIVSDIEMMNNIEFYFDLQSINEDIQAKEGELADKVKTLLEDGVSFSDIISVNASFVKAGNYERKSSFWKVEIILKGYQFVHNKLVGEVMKYKLVTFPGGIPSISGIGTVVERSVFFKVSPCEEKYPPRPPKNAFRNMLTEDIGKSSKATYSCQYGYNNTIGQKTVVSTCYSGKWDRINTLIRCEKAKCNMNELPVAPNYGRHNATIKDERKLVYKQNVLYSCQRHFIPNINLKIESICNAEGQWTTIIEYECLSEDYKKTFIPFNDDVQRWLRTPEYKRYPFSHFNFDTTDEDNWFYLVTIPSFIGLLLFLCCCLCATRTDSPLFLPCSDVGGPIKLRVVDS